MNAFTTATATETARIEAALDALLTAAIQANSVPSLTPERGPTSAGVLISEALEKFTWTPTQRAASALLSRPVWEVLRQGIRTLGERLYEIGGSELMRDVCDRVAAMDPARAGHRLDIMDKRWDGVGGDKGWLA